MPDELPKTQLPALTVDSIVPAPAAPETEISQLAFAGESQRAELEKQRLENAALRQDTAHRDKWGKRVFPMCAAWLLAVVVIMLLEGFHLFGFHLDNSVLIAFIGSTTADVIGLGYIVANYLFPKHP
jgi:hypothetical protein